MGVGEQPACARVGVGASTLTRMCTLRCWQQQRYGWEVACGMMLCYHHTTHGVPSCHEHSLPVYKMKSHSSPIAHYGLHMHTAYPGPGTGTGPTHLETILGPRRPQGLMLEVLGPGAGSRSYARWGVPFRVPAPLCLRARYRTSAGPLRHTLTRAGQISSSSLSSSKGVDERRPCLPAGDAAEQCLM